MKSSTAQTPSIIHDTTQLKSEVQQCYRHISISSFSLDTFDPENLWEPSHGPLQDLGQVLSTGVFESLGTVFFLRSRTKDSCHPWR